MIDEPLQFGKEVYNNFFVWRWHLIVTFTDEICQFSGERIRSLTCGPVLPDAGRCFFIRHRQYHKRLSLEMHRIS